MYYLNIYHTTNLSRITWFLVSLKQLRVLKLLTYFFFTNRMRTFNILRLLQRHKQQTKKRDDLIRSLAQEYHFEGRTKLLMDISKIQIRSTHT